MILLQALHRLAWSNSHACQTHHLQETELVAAGFPCIDVSRAGKREGIEGQVRP